MPSSRLAGSLKARAINWAGQLTIIAKEFAPAHIQPYISSHVTEIAEGQYSITVTADTKANPIEKYGSADARAQELGSGLHTTKRGKMDFIHIVPKNGKALVFKWDAVDVNSFPHTADGKVILKEVNSPGIYPYKGLGYLKPAIQEIRAKGKQDLSNDVRQAILGDLREAFSKGKR